jgi:hypothetical protein
MVSDVNQADVDTVEDGVQADLCELGGVPKGKGTVAQIAIVLARLLDRGAGAGLSTAAVARELRITMAALTEATRDDSDSNAAIESWIAGLSTSLDHPAKS